MDPIIKQLISSMYEEDPNVRPDIEKVRSLIWQQLGKFQPKEYYKDYEDQFYGKPN